MEKSHIILKNVIDKAGAKHVASQLGVSTALVYKWCQEKPKDEDNFDASGTANPLDRIRKIYEGTNDIELINWICQLADGFFTKNIKLNPNTIDKNIFKNSQKLIREFSETLDVISKSYNNGKQIDSNEARKIRKEWEDLKRVGETFITACESGHFKTKSKGAK